MKSGDAVGFKEAESQFHSVGTKNDAPKKKKLELNYTITTNVKRHRMGPHRCVATQNLIDYNSMMTWLHYIP